MIKAFQTVGWSLLSSEIVPLSGKHVIALIGTNGSGKSSTLDALKACLGSRRFGQNRTASTYRYAGRAGHPAARSAYVLCLIDNNHPNGGRRLDFVDDDEATLILEVGESQRRFLVLPGNNLLATGEQLGGAIVSLRSDRPRSEWMKPSEYEKRVLDPLGIGPAVRRLMELPQGELARVLNSDQKQFVGLLVELAGGRDASEAFTRAQQALADAREAHQEARRRVDRRRATLAEQQLAAQEAEQARKQRVKLSELLVDLQHHLQQLGPEPELAPRQISAVRQRSTSMRTAPSEAMPVAPPPRPNGVLDLRALRRAGVELELHGGVFCVREEHAERAKHMLAPGETIPVVGDDLDDLLTNPSLLRGAPAQRTERPVSMSAIRQVDDEPDAQAVPDESVQEAAREDPRVTRLRGNLKAAVRALTDAGLEPHGSNDELTETPEGAYGAYRALTSDGIPKAPRDRDLQALQQTAQDLAAEQADLATRAETLTEATERLGQARTAYQSAVQRALADASDRFSVMCQDAGLVGSMHVLDGPDGPQIQIHAAEAEGEALRPLWGASTGVGAASLSGGWKVSVLTLALLSALQGPNGLSVLCLDEVGSSLDEQRLTALGQAFARLSEKRGLQTIMTLPTGAMSDVVAQFATQQIGFVRPLPDEPLAPPPHIVTRGHDYLTEV